MYGLDTYTPVMEWFLIGNFQKLPNIYDWACCEISSRLLAVTYFCKKTYITDIWWGPPLCLFLVSCSLTGLIHDTKLGKLLKKGAYRNLTKVTGKHLYQSLFQPQAWNFIKKETLAQVFSCEFCEISKNTFLNRTPLVAASEVLIQLFYDVEHTVKTICKLHCRI